MYLNARLSAIRMVRDTFPSVAYVDLDDHANIHELPETDCVGLVGFAMSNEGEFHDIVFGVGIVTFNDKNLFRMTEMIDTIYRRLEPEQKFTIFNSTANPIGIATIFDGTNTSVVTRSEVRPACLVHASARIALSG